MSRIFDRGTGPALVVVPGMQGRWEWMRPALDALARRCRTIGYSLGGAGRRRDPLEALDGFIGELDRVLDACALERAAICGVSFGGLVALAYAATRRDRSCALILVSTPSPSWTPSAQQARYLAAPWRSTPAFLATAPGRLWPEIRAALPRTADRLAFAAAHAARLARFPVVPARMADRVKLTASMDLQADCARVSAPTLVVTGDPALDRVVPANDTREYLRLIAGARYAMMERTGHVGLITRPARFASILSEFVHAHCR